MYNAGRFQYFGGEIPGKRFKYNYIGDSNFNLLDAGVNINIKKYANITPFYFVSRNGYLALVEYLFYRGTKISHGWTPINFVANQGHLEIVKLLLERGSDIIMATNDG
ncbi:hypothetical protein PoMZ_02509 [Pyricularia oryzae]|uniref:Uncharacterized protein n=1 Tax=Pyricularia oryzae TaxID=318829 RepID=A0A4P7NBG9_PYROR|nr:hypothetical protein PoMZ_02509 [Pyricularia oryzae]